MKVTFDTDSLMTDSERDALIANLGITSANLPNALNGLANAAIAELLDMTTARDPQKLSPDTSQRRLEYLIRYYYKDRLPTETDIAQLFQISEKRAKILLENLHSTRRAAIEAQEKASIASALRTGKKKKDGVTVELAISSSYIYDTIKRIVGTRAAGKGLRSIEKQRGSVDGYDIGISAFNSIAPDFGVKVL